MEIIHLLVSAFVAAFVAALTAPFASPAIKALTLTIKVHQIEPVRREVKISLTVEGKKSPFFKVAGKRTNYVSLARFWFWAFKRIIVQTFYSSKPQTPYEKYWPFHNPPTAEELRDMYRTTIKNAICGISGVHMESQPDQFPPTIKPGDPLYPRSLRPEAQKQTEDRK